MVQIRHKVKNDKEKIRRMIRKIKENSSCYLCGEAHVSCLEFHHIGDKELEISKMLSKYTEEEILEEIKKCEIVCCNCHRKIHWQEKKDERRFNIKRYAS